MSMSIEQANSRKAELTAKVVTGDIETVTAYVAELVIEAKTYGVVNAIFTIGAIPHSITSIGTIFYIDNMSIGFDAHVIEIMVLDMLADYYLSQKFNALIAASVAA